jgi:hypothetical protein
LFCSLTLLRRAVNYEENLLEIGKRMGSSLKLGQRGKVIKEKGLNICFSFSFSFITDQTKRFYDSLNSSSIGSSLTLSFSLFCSFSISFYMFFFWFFLYFVLHTFLFFSYSTFFNSFILLENQFRIPNFLFLYRPLLIIFFFSFIFIIFHFVRRSVHTAFLF